MAEIDSKITYERAREIVIGMVGSMREDPIVYPVKYVYLSHDSLSLSEMKDVHGKYSKRNRPLPVTWRDACFARVGSF